MSDLSAGLSILMIGSSRVALGHIDFNEVGLGWRKDGDPCFSVLLLHLVVSRVNRIEEIELPCGAAAYVITAPIYPNMLYIERKGQDPSDNISTYSSFNSFSIIMWSWMVLNTDDKSTNTTTISIGLIKVAISTVEHTLRNHPCSFQCCKLQVIGITMNILEDMF